jgi:hypothetical protein
MQLPRSASTYLAEGLGSSVSGVTLVFCRSSVTLNCAAESELVALENNVTCALQLVRQARIEGWMML